MDEFYAPGVIDHDPFPAQKPGVDGQKQSTNLFGGSFSDNEWIVEDQIGEGDKVVTRWAVRRRHTGDFMGIPPTGREVVMRGTYTVRFSDGKVVEQWAHTDMLDLLRQLGFDIDRALREQMIEQGKQS